jgi:hypothetical protein
MNFDLIVKSLLEDFNIYPQAKNIQGRPAPSPGPNIDFRGPMPTGFKGSGPQGIAPGQENQILIKANKKKNQRTPEKKV